MSRGNSLLDHIVDLRPTIAHELRLDHFRRDQPIDPAAALVFPAGGVIAMCTSSSTGHTAELGLIGREGCFGMRDGAAASSPPLVEGRTALAGSMWCLAPSVADDALANDRRLGSTLRLFATKLQAGTGLQVLCNLHHSLEQRVCRWLLTAGDRIGGESLEITQQELADRLGVRRASVNVVARDLQTAGAIRYVSGDLHMVDRDELVTRSCECYTDLAARYRAIDT